MSSVSERGEPRPKRIAVVSAHTSPLAQPGTGDAGGMNVYVLQTALELARRGVSVEIFTRATSSQTPAVQQAAPGVLVRHVTAGPHHELNKYELTEQLRPFTAELLRSAARQPAGHYDVIHSHYWLSGLIGAALREHWQAPLVHTAHTLAAVKNEALAEGDAPEPASREIAEKQIGGDVDRMVTNTAREARDLVRRYGAARDRIDVVPPGVDLRRYRPGDRLVARAGLGLAADEPVVAFVGRIQALKGPDVLLRAAAEMARRQPLGGLRVLIVGGVSGDGVQRPEALMALADRLGIAERVTFWPPQPAERLAEIYRAADLVAVPSYNESFGLVALEAQASGTPVVAADVGGLSTAVRSGHSGVLVAGHQPADWADVMADLLAAPARLADMRVAARAHAARFSWAQTAEGLLASYGAALRTFRDRRADAAFCGPVWADTGWGNPTGAARPLPRPKTRQRTGVCR